MRGWHAIGLALAVMPVTPAVVANQAEPLPAVVRAAIAAGQTQRGGVCGFHDARRRFTELPPAQVLIGFECGVGRFIDIETVYALRAVYLAPEGVVSGPEHGPFADRKIGLNQGVKTRVLRTVRLQAPPGYAVGAVTLRTGLNVNGLSLTYMKIDGRRLDPGQARVSPWVGDRTGGRELSLGDGALVVGIHGSEDETHIQSLGLITLPPAMPRRPAPPAPPVPREEIAEPAAVPPPPIMAPPRRSWLPYAVLVILACSVTVASVALTGGRQRRPVSLYVDPDEPPRLPPVSPDAIRSGSPR